MNKGLMVFKPILIMTLLMIQATCFFCDEPAGSVGLHNACTYNIDTKVRKCALKLNDTALLAKLAPGDMIAIEAKYHSKCLIALNRAARSISALAS